MIEEQKTFGEFIKNYSFVIPDYQRAYSWEEKQINPFINDILEHCDGNDNDEDDTTYYLGHYILENSKDSVDFEIVDGQQRISTVYLFFLVCGYLTQENYVKNIKFNPVSYDLEGLEEIKTILQKREALEDELKNLKENSKTSSLKRMVEAVILFKKAFSSNDKNIALLKIDYIYKYIKIINNSYCSVAIFNDKSVASQIFELHNTRGIKLTETEKVKALLMKNIYINSSSPKEAESNIKEVQNDFAKIFELEEKANTVWLRGDMPLDTILMYHLRAVEDGNKNVDFGFPQWIEGDRGSFEYIKESLTNKTKEEIVKYCKNIAREFAKSMEIITIDIPETDKLDNKHLIGDILLLDKNKSLIFLLRAFRASNIVDTELIERWENFILCYDIIDWNGFFYRTQYRDRFVDIYASLKPNSGFDECKTLLFKIYNGQHWFGSGWLHLGNNTKKLFEDGKNKFISDTFGWNKVGYILYKFEIQNGADYNKIRTEIFKNDKVSIDHIVARGLTWESLGCKEFYSLSEDDEKRKHIDKLWKEILGVINGIGNLALSTTSSNSSDSNGLPKEHIDTYEKCGFIETFKQVKTWENPEQFSSKINNRSNDIIKFISESIINRNDIWE
jgi:hypothetical protein